MGELPADKVVYFEAREGQEQILQLWEDMDIRLEVVGASGVGKSGECHYVKFVAAFVRSVGYFYCLSFAILCLFAFLLYARKGFIY